MLLPRQQVTDAFVQLTLGWPKPSPKASHLRPIASSRLSDSFYAASRVAEVQGDDSDKDSPSFGRSAQPAVSAIGVAAGRAE